MECELISIIEDGKVVDNYYRVVLSDPYGNLTSRCFELPAKQLLSKENLRIISEYESKEDSRDINSSVQKAFLEARKKGGKAFRFKNVGWNQRNGEAVFSFSNCCITKTTVDFDNYSIEKGFELYVSENFGEGSEFAKTRFLELMGILAVRPDIFYPVLFMNIAALLNHILGIKGKAPALVMWLGGAPGSGKTELAKNLGSFINKDRSDRTKIGQNIITSIVKPSDMVEALAKHHGINFILDDVKAEKAQGQKERSRTCVDVCIRSIKEQRILSTYLKDQKQYLNMKLDAGGIITGESMDLFRSSIARMVYVCVDGFINDKQASNALRKLQEYPQVFADYMVCMIQFLCRKYDHFDYWDMLIRKKETFWINNNSLFFGSNQSRLADTLSSMQIVIEVVKDFAKECGAADSYDIEQFGREADAAVIKAMKNTALLIQEEDDLLLEAFQEVFSGLKIQIPRRILNDYNNWEMEPYILRKDYEGIWIDDIKKLTDLTQDNKKIPVIICPVDIFYRKLEQKIVELVDRYQYKGNWKKGIDNTRLRKAGIICGKQRNDNCYDNQFNYPKYVSEYGVDFEWWHSVCLNPDNHNVHQKLDLFEAQEAESYLLLEDLSDREYRKVEYCEVGKGEFLYELRKAKKYLSERNDISLQGK